MFAATVGATVLFVLARASLGDAARSAPWLQRLSAGFRGNALNYLLFLRLVPLFPFVAVNWAPALFGMPLSTYVVGTFFGMIPVTVAYAVTGSGLGGVLEAQNAVYAACLDQQLREPNLACLYTLDTGQLITCELTAGLLVMGLLALLPVAMKRWSARNAVRRRDGKIRGFVADDAP